MYLVLALWYISCEEVFRGDFSPQLLQFWHVNKVIIIIIIIIIIINQLYMK